MRIGLDAVVFTHRGSSGLESQENLQSRKKKYLYILLSVSLVFSSMYLLVAATVVGLNVVG